MYVLLMNRLVTVGLFASDHLEQASLIDFKFPWILMLLTNNINLYSLDLNTITLLQISVNNFRRLTFEIIGFYESKTIPS